MARTNSKRSTTQLTLSWSVVALLSAGESAIAQQARTSLATTAFENRALHDLEYAFWICDYIATTRGTAAADPGTCSAVSDALRQRKFDGDLDKLVAWWNQHKAGQYSRLSQLDPDR